MADIYEFYEKRIQGRVLEAIEDMKKGLASAVARGEETDQLETLSEYQCEVTNIVIDECNNYKEAFLSIIPRYLPDGITLDNVKIREEGDPGDTHQ